MQASFRLCLNRTCSAVRITHSHTWNSCVVLVGKRVCIIYRCGVEPEHIVHCYSIIYALVNIYSTRVWKHTLLDIGRCRIHTGKLNNTYKQTSVIRYERPSLARHSKNNERIYLPTVATRVIVILYLLCTLYRVF